MLPGPLWVYLMEIAGHEGERGRPGKAFTRKVTVREHTILWRNTRFSLFKPAIDDRLIVPTGKRPAQGQR